ncbi:hypothetical protein DSO57_1017691 [Entomophthora muscae]|uniref:Uncharacterized protein n=1 Tax=Entomophthora muscae TaxID=34485 RepID=A0ACC2T4N2_9FUNG|nr:hypothetical protein DSO57_1017691 [Entomophthora muscae]
MKAQFFIASFAAMAFAAENGKNSTSSEKTPGANSSAKAGDSKMNSSSGLNSTAASGAKNGKSSNGYAFTASVAMSAIAAFAASFSN